jgi:hypothetical protein
LIVASLAIWSGCSASALRAQDAADPLTRAELERALQQRDAVIAELLQRVEELERAGAGRTVAPGAPVVEAPPAETPAPADTASGEAPAPPEPEAAERRETAQTEAPAPGQFEIDQEAAERALDFTLVQQGALLLPAGRVEFSPSFAYTRRTGDFPIIVNGFLSEREVRRNEFVPAVDLRVGLPFDSQLELGLPYNIVDQSVADEVGGNAQQEDSNTGHAWGDLSVGLAKTVLRQKHWWPDVVVRLDWDTGTGERSDNDVALDGGFQSLTGSFSLAERQDPLVFVAGASYETVFEDDDIDPGDTLSFSIGTFLAVTPKTSLSLVLNQSFINDLEVDGEGIDGSDRVQSVLSFGASAILARNVLLDGAVGVGLTDDSPDYSVSVALPIRFNLPAF